MPGARLAKHLTVGPHLAVRRRLVRGLETDLTVEALTIMGFISIVWVLDRDWAFAFSFP
jgi:hypothetical protein